MRPLVDVADAGGVGRKSLDDASNTGNGSEVDAELALALVEGSFDVPTIKSAAACKILTDVVVLDTLDAPDCTASCATVEVVLVDSDTGAGEIAPDCAGVSLASGSAVPAGTMTAGGRVMV